MNVAKLVYRLVEKWAPRFGFGHYTMLVEAGTEEDRYAHIRYNVEEEWFCLTYMAGLEQLTPKQVEHVVLHELSHVLQAIGQSGEMGEEVVCNRVASLLIGKEHGVRSLAFEAGARRLTDEERESLEDVLPHMLVRMQPEHREVLCWFFYDHPDLGLRELARLKGIPKTTLATRRDAALAALGEMFG